MVKQMHCTYQLLAQSTSAEPLIKALPDSDQKVMVLFRSGRVSWKSLRLWYAGLECGKRQQEEEGNLPSRRDEVGALCSGSDC